MRIYKIIAICMIVLTVVSSATFSTICYANFYPEFKADAKMDTVAVDNPVVEVPADLFSVMPFKYTHIKGMKAVKIIPNVDIYKDVKSDESAALREIDMLLKQLKKLDFNSIIVDTLRDTNVIFKSSYLKSTPVDYMKLLVDKATEQNVSIMALYNMSNVLDKDGNLIKSHLSSSAKTALDGGIHELASYKIDGILLGKYYMSNDSLAYNDYVNYGGTVPFDKWVYESVIESVRLMSDAVSSAKNSLPIGLSVDSVWDTKDKSPLGIDATAKFSALQDGFSDTKNMVEKGVIDFVEVNANTALSNTELGFKTVVEWWDNVCNKKIPMYVTHKGENAVTDAVGYDGTDEMAREVSTASKCKSYYGSAFTGLSRLMENPKGSTDILLKYYKNEYSDDELFKDLTIISPNKKAFTTYEAKIQFKGNFDPNQIVLLNGKKLNTSERGGFSQWIDLKVGKNDIVLEHKGKDTVYSIERKVNILKGATPTGNVLIQGLGSIELNVTAYKGSTVTAVINGSTLALKPAGGGDNNLADSDYVNYQGKYKAPKALAKPQPLGKITFKGNYKGYAESLNGANITIDKIPDDVDPDAATGKVMSHAVVKDTYGEVAPYNTAPKYASSILYQLPKGTKDIIVSKNGNYLNLRSGKSIDKKYVDIVDTEFMGNNIVSNYSVGIEGMDTVFRLGMSWEVPFSIDLSPYPDDIDAMKHSYEFLSSSLTITLDYTTKMEAMVGSLSGNPLFSSVTGERVFNEQLRIWQYKIRLQLARAGRYFGAYATYEGNTLVIRFNNPMTSLNGVKIAVDAGHGGNDHGTVAGRDGDEKSVNYSIATKLKAELEALGASVIFVRNGDTNPSLPQRVEQAFSVGADMLISCHHNSAGSNSEPNGVETYFNAPFSQPLATSIQKELGKNLNNRGVKCAAGDPNFYMNRPRQFPSVLIEYAFLSNPSDEALARSEAHQNTMAKATAQGILNYYIR